MFKVFPGISVRWSISGMVIVDVFSGVVMDVGELGEMKVGVLRMSGWESRVLCVYVRERGCGWSKPLFSYGGGVKVRWSVWFEELVICAGDGAVCRGMWSGGGWGGLEEWGRAGVLWRERGARGGAAGGYIGRAREETVDGQGGVGERGDSAGVAMLGRVGEGGGWGARDIETLLEDMDQDSTHMVAASKVPMLKPGEFELWRMRIEQYIQMIDYALWEVIENGATLSKTQVMEGVTTVMP
ncbi:hypothetical protein Tco_0886975, partial [Tanacetum coccineum]